MTGVREQLFLLRKITGCAWASLYARTISRRLVNRYADSVASAVRPLQSMSRDRKLTLPALDWYVCRASTAFATYRNRARWCCACACQYTWQSLCLACTQCLHALLSFRCSYSTCVTGSGVLPYRCCLMSSTASSAQPQCRVTPPPPWPVLHQSLQSHSQMQAPPVTISGLMCAG